MVSARSFLRTACALAACLGSHAPAAETAREVAVDFSRVLGNFRPLHGLNNAPVGGRGGDGAIALFKQAAIPLCRLHDVPHSGTHAVDIASIFPLAHADPDDPRNYTFARTDDYIQGILDTGAKIVYRLGSSIEHSPRKYDVNPPADPSKWARVCVNIIRHYNEGWADGFHHDIRYWEIWNEPDLGPATWTGTPQQFFELYAVAAKAIKRHNPKLMVGGPGLAGNMEFLDDFLTACSESRAPLDFLSWHQYTANPLAVGDKATNVRRALDKHGFPRAESHLNEWHFFNGDWKRLRADPAYAKRLFEELNGTRGATFAAATMALLQDRPVDVANYYTGDTTRWGLFDTSGLPHKTYFAFRAFHEFSRDARRIACAGNSEVRSDIVAAALSNDGKSARILVCNLGEESRAYHIHLHSPPWKTSVEVDTWALDSEHDFTRLPSARLAAGTSVLEATCPAFSFRLIELTPAADSH